LAGNQEKQAAARHDVSRLARGAGIALIGRIVGRGINIVNQAVLARLLGPAAYGLVAIGWILLRIGNLFTVLGLDNGVLRFGSQIHRDKKADFRKLILLSLGIALIVGSLAGGLLYLGAPWLGISVFADQELIPVFRSLAIAFPLVSGLTVAAAVTRVSQRMQFSVLAEDLTQPIVMLGLLLFVFLLGMGLSGVIFAIVVSYLAAFALSLLLIRYLYSDTVAAPQPGRFPVGKLLAFSIPTALTSVFINLIIWSDRLFVGYFGVAEDVGIYQAASQASLLFAVIIGAFNVAFAPMIADFFHRNEIDRMAHLFRTSTKWGLYVGAPLFLSLFFAPTEVLTIVFGHEYAIGALPLVILVAGQVVNLATGPVGNLLIMTGRQKPWVLVTAFAFLANVMLNIILIPRFGLTGAAVATSVATSASFLGGLLIVSLSLGLWPYDRRILKGLSAAALTIAALYAQSYFDIANPLARFGLIMLISISVFLGALLVFRLDDEDRDLIEMVKLQVRESFNNRAATR